MTNLSLNIVKSEIGAILCVRRYINESDLADCHAIYSYLIYIGEKWKRCEVCGKYIKEGKTKKIKYCSDCAKKINLEKTKMNLRENIKMKK